MDYNSNSPLFHRHRLCGRADQWHCVEWLVTEYRRQRYHRAGHGLYDDRQSALEVRCANHKSLPHQSQLASWRVPNQHCWHLPRAMTVGLAVGQPRPNSTNYINNPSFEVNTTDYWEWYGGPTVAQISGGYSGDYCASMTTGATSNPYMYSPNLIGGPAYTVGQVWVLSAYVKAGNASAVGKTVTMNIREDGNNSYKTSANFVITADWQRISVTHTLATAATNLDHWIQITSVAGSNDALLIDAVQMELNQLTGYIDGSMEGAAWGSTAHNSISTQASHSYLAYVDRSARNADSGDTDDVGEADCSRYVL